MGKQGNHGKTKGYPIWNKGLTKENNESLRRAGQKLKERYASGDLIHYCKGKHLSEETKRKISLSLKKWHTENKDKHSWKTNDKFISAPCEHLKQFLKSKGIQFVDEYEPFDDVHYCLDIAWPDEKIAIEVNGNQHYNSDGSLKPYYQKRHDLFEQRGWTIYEVHFSKCYYPQIDDFEDILNLPIYDKDYVGEYFSKKEKQQQKKHEEELKKQKEILEKERIKARHIEIINDLINNSNIDFSKMGWNKKAKEYLIKNDSLFDKVIFRAIRKYRPDFLKRDDVWKRHGSIY